MLLTEKLGKELTESIEIANADQDLANEQHVAAIAELNSQLSSAHSDLKTLEQATAVPQSLVQTISEHVDDADALYMLALEALKSGEFGGDCDCDRWWLW